MSKRALSSSLRNFAAGVVLAFASQPVAFAQGLDSSAIAAARELGAAGVASYEKGEFAQASDRLERAYGIVRIPTFGLWSARALDKTGRLLEAGERYREVLRIPIKPTDPDVFRAAMRDAQTDYDALAPRIPQLTIEVTGVPAGTSTITIDGKALPPQLIGVPVPLNPGARHVEARSGNLAAARDVTLVESKQERLVLDLASGGVPAGQPAPVSALPPASGPAAPNELASPPPTADQGAGGSKMPAFIAFGVGGAGLVVGGIFGALALSAQSQLKNDCPSNVCGPSHHADVDSYNGKRVVSFVGLGVGVVGAALGTVLLLTSSSEGAPPKSARIEPWIGLGAVGARGSF